MLARLAQTLTGPRLKLPAHKAATLRSRIMPTPLPEQLFIALPVDLDLKVAVGDQVARQQLLAGSAGAFGQQVLAPTSGKVVAISDPVRVGQHAATGTRYLTLAADHQDQGSQLPPISDYRAAAPEATIARIAAAGVVCTAARERSVAATLSRSSATATRLVLVNAAEPEPYLCADEALIREYAREVLTGMAILKHASQAERAVIVMQRGKAAALAALREALQEASADEIELVLLPANDYPRGTDPQVIRTVSSLELRRDQDPAAFGVLQFSVSSAAAVSAAVTTGAGHLGRVVALAGTALRTPKCFNVPFGTPISHLLSLSGCQPERLDKILLGGPLRGQQLDAAETPVDISTAAVIAAGESELPPRAGSQDCIQCGDCIPVCPVRLQPQFLHELHLRQQDWQLLQHGVDDCIQCGACSYVCPSNIDLVAEFRVAQERLANLAHEQHMATQWQQRFQFHQYRLKRDREQSQDVFAAPAAVSASQADTGAFSRDQARAEIAAAVARVRARRKPGSNPERNQSEPE